VTDEPKGAMIIDLMAALKASVAERFEPRAESSEQTHPHQCPTCGEHWEHASDACEVIYPHKEWAKCPFCEGRDE